MAETAINAVLSKFGELATREAAVLLQVGGDIMQLRDQLEWLQAFIRDADRKRRDGTVDGLTLVWVRQTRNAAFDAEDAVDEFFHKGYLRSQGDERWLRYLTRIWSEITVRHSLSGQIKSIRRTLEDTSNNRKQYNIEHTPSRIWTSSATALSPRDVPEINMEEYIKKNMETLGNLLEDKDARDKMVISVVGKSGSGKYTLVDLVYHKMKGKKKMKGKFCRIWYDMPPDSSTQDVLKQVYKRAYKKINKGTEPNCHLASEEDMAAKLHELLFSSKYLVVLSGISSKTLLNCMWASLPDNSNGSRVVLILESGHYDVAKHGADTLNKKKKDDTILWLSPWGEETSARLFQVMLKVPGKEVKESGGKVSNEDKQYVYAMSEGNPMAITVLAGLFRHKEPVEREALLKQLNPNGNRMPAIHRILSACYDDLPQDLKSCLLYLAAYPKNAPQLAEKIVRMWTAEGFIRRQKGKTPEDLGRMYLDELVSRCLVKRIGKKDGCSPEKVKVHGRVLEFLQSEAHQANFIEIHDRCDVLEPAVVRRLSVQDDGNGFTLPKSCFPMMRSFICRVEDEEEQEKENETGEGEGAREEAGGAGEGEGDGAREEGGGAREGGGAGEGEGDGAREGGGAGGEGDGAGEEGEGEGDGADHINSNTGTSSTLPLISAGSGLRCVWSSMLSCLGLGPALDVPAGRRDISFLCQSKFLRVLSVQGLSLVELPEGMGDMIHLRYIRVNCHGLKKLPSSMWKLLNLETLDITGTEVEKIDPMFWAIKALRHVLADNLTLPPASSVAEELRELQTLHGVKPDQDDHWDCRSPLHKMTKLRSLELHGLESREHGVALADALKKMHLLGHLKLKGDVIPSCVFTAPNLRCLQTMVLLADVEWGHLPLHFNVHHARPNLVQLKLKDKTDVPVHIRDDLGNILVQHKSL